MEDQVLTGHKPVPMKIANKAMKSICKITISKKLGESNGTGFFFKSFKFNKMPSYKLVYFKN